jgi:hypothetical protein
MSLLDQLLHKLLTEALATEDFHGRTLIIRDYALLRSSDPVSPGPADCDDTTLTATGERQRLASFAGCLQSPA